MFSFFFDSYHAREADFGFSSYDDYEPRQYYRKHYENQAPHTFTCKYCGKQNLRYQNVGDKYIPYENGKPHNCDFSALLNAGD